MSLHEDLLRQAEMLATIDPRRPKQVNLRRSISTAYYALFHLLTTAASSLFTADATQAARIARTLNHGDMRKISQMIGHHKLPKAFHPLSPTYTTQADVKIVADAFVFLQQARHEADYDLMLEFDREEALECTQTAREALRAWDRVKKTSDAKLFLACFHLWNQWDKDPR